MPDLKTAASVSIVVPFHNEEPNVIEMYGRLQGVMEELGRSYQFVFIDDGSTNLTYKLLKEVAMIDPRVTIVRPVCAQPPHLIMTFRRHCRNAGAETRFHSSMFLPYIELAES